MREAPKHPVEEEDQRNQTDIQYSVSNRVDQQAHGIEVEHHAIVIVSRNVEADGIPESTREEGDDPIPSPKQGDYDSRAN
jgi:hypothetical protein